VVMVEIIETTETEEEVSVDRSVVNV